MNGAVAAPCGMEPRETRPECAGPRRCPRVRGLCGPFQAGNRVCFQRGERHSLLHFSISPAVLHRVLGLSSFLLPKPSSYLCSGSSWVLGLHRI